MFYKVVLTILAIIGAVEASEIVSTSTSTGEVAYVVNCSTPCTVKLAYPGPLNACHNVGCHNLVAEASHMGLEYGYFDSMAATTYNISIWEGTTPVDSKLVNLGTFSPTFTTEVNNTLGKTTVGIAFMFGVALGSLLLGLEGGLLIAALGIMVAISSGYFPEWPLYIILLIASALFGLGLYTITKGWSS